MEPFITGKGRGSMGKDDHTGFGYSAYRARTGAAQDAVHCAHGCVTVGWYRPAVLCFPASSNLTAAFCTSDRPHLLARHGTQPGTPLLYLIPHLHTLHTWSHSHCCWSEKTTLCYCMHSTLCHGCPWPCLQGDMAETCGVCQLSTSPCTPAYGEMPGPSSAAEMCRDLGGAMERHCAAAATESTDINCLAKTGMGQAQDIPFHSVPTKEKRSATPSSILLPKPDCQADAGTCICSGLGRDSSSSSTCSRAAFPLQNA